VAVQIGCAVALAAGCRGSERSAPAPGPTARTTDAATPALDAATPAPDAATPTPTPDAATPAPAPPPGPTDITLTLDGETAALRYGYATTDVDGLRLSLYSGPIDCATRNRFGADADAAGARLLVEIPAGPGRTFFAGHPIGIHVIVESPGQTTQVAGLPAMSATLPMSPASVALTLAPFRARKGEHVRGSFDGGEAVLIGTSSAHGRFDVILCDDPEPGAPRMRATAPAGAARGVIGGTALVPRSVQAIVRHRAVSRDEAVDVTIHRTVGGLREVWELAFYAEASVPCPPPGEDWDPATPPLFRLQGPGGTGEEHPFTRTAQPASGVLRRGTDDFGAVWAAWVQWDQLAWIAGAKVRGSLWAESLSYDDVHGHFGGHFEAVVCDTDAASFDAHRH
jgi:hypothetical protein